MGFSESNTSGTTPESYTWDIYVHHIIGGMFLQKRWYGTYQKLSHQIYKFNISMVSRPALYNLLRRMFLLKDVLDILHKKWSFPFSFAVIWNFISHTESKLQWAFHIIWLTMEYRGEG